MLKRGRTAIIPLHYRQYVSQEMTPYLLKGTASGKLKSISEAAAIESGTMSAQASRGPPEFSVWNVIERPITVKM